MEWKTCALNRLYPKHSALISTVDTGHPETSVNTTTPTAGENELIVTSENLQSLSNHKHDEFKALMDAIATSYNLETDNTCINNAYRYTFTKPS